MHDADPITSAFRFGAEAIGLLVLSGVLYAWSLWTSTATKVSWRNSGKEGGP